MLLRKKQEAAAERDAAQERAALADVTMREVERALEAVRRQS